MDNVGNLTAAVRLFVPIVPNLCMNANVLLVPCVGWLIAVAIHQFLPEICFVHSVGGNHVSVSSVLPATPAHALALLSCVGYVLTTRVAVRNVDDVMPLLVDVTCALNVVTQIAYVQHSPIQAL